MSKMKDAAIDKMDNTKCSVCGGIKYPTTNVVKNGKEYPVCSSCVDSNENKSIRPITEDGKFRISVFDKDTGFGSYLNNVTSIMGLLDNKVVIYYEDNKSLIVDLKTNKIEIA